MRVSLKLDHADVKVAIAEHVARLTGVEINALQLRLQVKSTHNYKAEWEEATSRVECEVDTK